MLLKDSGIGLRFYPFGNTSSVGIWLTRDHGKVATRLKGRQRPNSRLLGQADCFYTCELLFYAREHRNIHILKEATPLDTRDRLRNDWRACAVASYMAWLADRSMPFGPAGPGFYEQLEAGLDHVATQGAGPAYLLRFEARWLSLLGALPSFEQCSRCQRPLAETEKAWLAPDGHGLYCRDCLGAEQSPSALSFAEIPPAVRQALFALSAEDEPHRSGLPASVFRATSALLSRLVAVALDLRTPSRERESALAIAGQ